MLVPSITTSFAALTMRNQNECDFMGYLVLKVFTPADGNEICKIRSRLNLHTFGPLLALC